MTADYRITPRAYKDLLGIARYTLREWGREQRDVYMREMDKRHRPEIAEGYYSFSQGSHLVFYLVRDGGVTLSVFRTSRWMFSTTSIESE